MHDATQAFRRAREIGAAKSVSFEKKNNSVRFKISLRKVLKLKKIRNTGGVTIFGQASNCLIDGRMSTSNFLKGLFSPEKTPYAIVFLLAIFGWGYCEVDHFNQGFTPRG